MTNEQGTPDIARGVVRWLIRTVIFSVLIALALFLPSGDWNWGMGWAYIGVFVLIQVINLATLLRASPDLLVERADIQEGTKDWDRLLSSLVALFGPLSMWVVAGLDRRYHGSPEIPAWLQITSLVVILLGSLLPIWAMIANRYFSGTVRIQEERGHEVATGGPYRFIRHPGYAGAAIYDLGTPLALGSVWTFAPAALTVVFVILRTALEDKTLLEELQGYQEYAQQVKYRLLPGIW